MDLKLLNKVALVGGSSKGIGKGCAVQLAKEGAHVVLCARNLKSLSETADHIRSFSRSEVLSVAGDLSKKEDIKHMVETTVNKFNRIDILVVNSGGPKPGNFFELDEKDWHEAYQSVLFYVVELYKHVIPLMITNKWGRIINITSLAVKEPNENLILSNVFRTGVVSMAKTISKQLIASNITINNICPGAFKTDRATQLILNKALKEGITAEEVEKNMIQGFPGKRFNTIDEIGNLVSFLSSDLAQGITGTTLQIDGGISSSLF